MSTSGLWHDIKHNPLALVAAILLHVVLIVILSINLQSSQVHVPKRVLQKTVEAVVVDAAKVDEQIAKLRRKEQAKKAAQQREQDKVKQQIAAEKQRVADLKKKEAQRKEAAKNKKIAVEKQRKAELKKQQEAERKQAQLKAAERKQKVEAEKQRQAELKRKQEQDARLKREAEEAKRQADLKKKQEAEEAKRQAELKQKQEAEARRKQAEEELQRKLAEEERLEREAVEAAERAARLDVLRLQYVRMIEQQVTRNWLRPVGVKTTPECQLHVTQTRLGDVLDVAVRNCQGDAVYVRSIERAVRGASPLPPPPDPDVFEKEILFTFKP